MAGTINAANISIGFDGSKLKAGEELTRSSLNTIRQNMSKSLSDNERYRAEMAQLGIALNKGAIDNTRYAEAVEFVSKKYGIITPLMQKLIETEKREADEKQRKIALQKQEDEELKRHISLTRSVETATERHTRQIREYHQELRKGVIDHETYNRLVRQSSQQMNASGGMFGSSSVGGIALGSMMGNMASNAAFRAVDMLQSAAVESLKLAANVETATVAFEVLTQSADQAKRMVGEIKRLDQTSVLSFIDIQQGAKTMLGYGVAVKDVMPNLEALSEVSMGNAEVFQRLSLAFSQTMAKGKLAGEEVRQMVNAGFNPLQTIAEKLSAELGGTTAEQMTKLGKYMEEGAISAKIFQDALRAATEEGGRFAAMNEKMLQTTQGKWNKLVSEMQMAGTAIGEALKPATDALLDFASAQAKASKDSPLTSGAGGIFGAIANWGAASAVMNEKPKDEKPSEQMTGKEIQKELDKQRELDKTQKELNDQKQRVAAALEKSNRMVQTDGMNTLEKQITAMKTLREEELRRRGQSPELMQIDNAIKELQKANAENLAQKADEERKKVEEKNARIQARRDEIEFRGKERLADEKKNFDRRMKESSNPDNLTSNVAPAVKAGTAEAYKFLIDRQEKISSRAEQIAEKSAEHLERIANINEDMKRDLERAPRIVKVGP